MPRYSFLALKKYWCQKTLRRVDRWLFVDDWPIPMVDPLKLQKSVDGVLFVVYVVEVQRMLMWLYALLFRF
jgi:hypothetical protein